MQHGPLIVNTKSIMFMVNIYFICEKYRTKIIVN